MEINVLQEDLVKTLNSSIRFISNKSTLPILGNFLLIAEKTKLKIQATNLEMSLSASVGAKIKEEGSVTVPAKTFLELIANIPLGQLTLSTDKEKLKIESSGVSVSLATIPVNDFPKIPDSIDKKNIFNLKVQDLKSALNKILFATSLDETRPVLTGVLFIFEENTLSLISSDGFRLSRKNLTLNESLGNKKIIIPRSSLIELIKIANNIDLVEFETRETDNQLVAKIGDLYLGTRLIDGNFPDFEKIIPANSSTTITLAKDDLSRGVKLASVFARVEGNIVKIKIEESQIEITSENSKFGKQKNIIESKVSGATLEISYNYKFLEDFLNTCESEDVEIKLTDSVSPTIFVDTKDKDFLHIIMPVRVQS